VSVSVRDLAAGGRVEPFRSADGIVWVKDADRTILINEESGETCTLLGVDAAIWDLFCLGYRFECAVHFLGALLGLPHGRAAELLRSTADAWCEAGWLRRAGGQEGTAGGGHVSTITEARLFGGEPTLPPFPSSSVILAAGKVPAPSGDQGEPFELATKGGA